MRAVRFIIFEQMVWIVFVPLICCKCCLWACISDGNVVFSPVRIPNSAASVRRHPRSNPLVPACGNLKDITLVFWLFKKRSDRAISTKEVRTVHIYTNHYQFSLSPVNCSYQRRACRPSRRSPTWGRRSSTRHRETCIYLVFTYTCITKVNSIINRNGK